MTRSYMGDPTAAMLEVSGSGIKTNISPITILMLPSALREVVFCGYRQNALDYIPRPLHDRLEVLRVSGYPKKRK